MSGVAKVTFNGQTLIDVTDKTVTAAKMLSTGTALDKAGDSITGSIASKSSSDLTVSGATVTAPAGYYSSSASKSVASGSAGTPTATKGSVSNHSISVTPSVTNTTGYITGSTKTGTAVTVSASELVSGNKSITSNGTGIDVANYSTVSVAVPTGTINNQNKTVTPTTSQQTVTADSGYTGLGTVTVESMPVGSQGTPLQTRIKTPVLNPTQLTVRINDSSATGLTPGYFDSFSDQVNFTLENKTVTPSTSTQTITPTSTSYYLDSVTVNPIPSQYVIPSGNLSITSNGSYNVKNYLTATVNISGGGTYTATISGNSPDPDATVIEAPDGIWYDTNGQIFSFNPGQTVTIFAYSGSGGDIYIDGSLVGNTEYAYTLPSSDVTFTFQPPSGEDDVSVVTSPGSLVCETGTYTPTSDIAQPTISFANTHTLPPMFIMFEDTSSTTYASDAPANTGIWWTFNDWYRMTGTGTASSSTATQYGRVQYGYRSTAGGSITSGGNVLTYDSDNTSSSSNAYPRWWATPTGFKPYVGSTSRYWRTGHTYKWTAVWK